MSVAAVTGWLAALLVVLAASAPLVQLLRAGRRAAPASPPIRLHVALGTAAAAGAFFHTLTTLGALGSPGATGGGMAALAPGAAALFVLVAHTGIGLQLRRPKLKDRPSKRRTHVLTATTVAVLVAVHAVLLLRAG